MLKPGSILIYNPKLKEKARYMRNNPTPGEKKLWYYLKGNKMHGYDFHRQKPIFNYIVDFYSPKLKCIIEIDGRSHEGKEYYDEIRQKFLESLDLTVIRFTEKQIHKDLPNVLQYIHNFIEQFESKHLPNPPQGGNIPTRKTISHESPPLRED